MHIARFNACKTMQKIRKDFVQYGPNLYNCVGCRSVSYHMNRFMCCMETSMVLAEDDIGLSLVFAHSLRGGLLYSFFAFGPYLC